MLVLLMQMVTDTLATVPDVMIQTDTIGDLVGDMTEFAGNYIELLVLTLLGLFNRFLVQGAKLVQTAAGKLPGPVVATIAFATAQLIAFVNVFLLGWGSPVLPEDPTMLVAGLEGIVIWFVSMGWHGFLKNWLGSRGGEGDPLGSRGGEG